MSYDLFDENGLAVPDATPAAPAPAVPRTVTAQEYAAQALNLRTDLWITWGKVRITGAAGDDLLPGTDKVILFDDRNTQYEVDPFVVLDVKPVPTCPLCAEALGYWGILPTSCSHCGAERR